MAMLTCSFDFTSGSTRQGQMVCFLISLRDRARYSSQKPSGLPGAQGHSELSVHGPVKRLGPIHCGPIHPTSPARSPRGAAAWPRLSKAKREGAAWVRTTDPRWRQAQVRGTGVCEDDCLLSGAARRLQHVLR